MKISYYNTAIRELSYPKSALTVKAALTAIELEQYGNTDAWIADEYWRVRIDNKEYLPSEAAAAVAKKLNNQGL